MLYLCSRSELPHAPGNFPPAVVSGRICKGLARGLWTLEEGPSTLGDGYTPGTPPGGTKHLIASSCPSQLAAVTGMRGHRMLSSTGPLPGAWSICRKKGNVQEKLKKKIHRLLKGILVLFKAPAVLCRSVGRWLPGQSPGSDTQRGHDTIQEVPGHGRGFFSCSVKGFCPHSGPVQPKTANAQQET